MILKQLSPSASPPSRTLRLVYNPTTRLNLAIPVRIIQSTHVSAKSNRVLPQKLSKMSFAEFISVTFPNASTELQPIPGAKADPDFIERYSRGLDDYDFNYTLIPCR